MNWMTPYPLGLLALLMSPPSLSLVSPMRLMAHARYPVHIIAHEPDPNARQAAFIAYLSIGRSRLVGLLVRDPRSLSEDSFLETKTAT